MYTKQETFDMAVGHLIKQGQRAISEDGTNACLYRGSEGTKCAVGALIPDELYTEEIEGYDSCDIGAGFDREYFEKAQYSPEQVNKMESLSTYLKTNHDQTLIDSLQHAHDVNETYEEMMDEIDKIAVGYELRFVR